jgi:putative peptide zinc metalloprotease protein
VAADTLLLQMASPNIKQRTEQIGARREGLSVQSAAAGFDPEQRKNWQVLNEQLAIAKADESSVSADAAHYAPTAPYAGTLHDVDPDLRVGSWVGNRELLGRLVADGPSQVVTYVEDEDIPRISLGDRALFVSDGLHGPTLRLVVVDIDRNASPTLSEPELASPFGGHVLVREKSGVFYPERAVYRVLLKVVSDNDAPQHSWRGLLAIAGDWEAPGMRFLRTMFTVLWRETGF